MPNKNMIFAAGMMYMAAMENQEMRKFKEYSEDDDPKEIIPNGCKKYYFTKSGEHFNENPNGYEIVFECIASNDKTAQNKFKKSIVL